jgi:SRSO17 transposase
MGARSVLSKHTAALIIVYQYLGSVGEINNGIVAVTTLWTNEQRYYPLHVATYTPESRLPEGKKDPAFHSKRQLALALIERALAASIAFKAIVADCFYGRHRELVATLRRRSLPFVLSHRGSVGRSWALEEMAHSFHEALGKFKAARLANPACGFHYGLTVTTAHSREARYIRANCSRQKR